MTKAQRYEMLWNDMERAERDWIEAKRIARETGDQKHVNDALIRRRELDQRQREFYDFADSM